MESKNTIRSTSKQSFTKKEQHYATLLNTNSSKMLSNQASSQKQLNSAKYLKQSTETMAKDPRKSEDKIHLENI